MHTALLVAFIHDGNPLHDRFHTGKLGHGIEIVTTGLNPSGPGGPPGIEQRHFPSTDPLDAGFKGIEFSLAQMSVIRIAGTKGTCRVAEGPL